MENANQSEPKNSVMPTGTVTLMFTDIEGSTTLWEELGKEVMLPVLETHNTILRQAKDNWFGYEIRSEGDAFFFAFQTASDAVQCAVGAQLALSQHAWPEAAGEIRVRIGIHTGDVSVLDRDYQGTPANLAKRITDAGHGGQILISATTQALVREQFPQPWFLDLGVYRLKNLHHSEQIFQIASPELQREFPPLRTLDSLPNNLPAQLTSFIGREAEIRKIADLLGKEQVRLVTLTGPGGIGKTRLSIQVATDQLEHFPDGVWFIPLASLTDPMYVAAEIASVLAIRLQPQIDPQRQVIDYLAQKRLLLVLDNFEHLPEAASFVNDLLLRAPSLRCLVTSRELLQVSGEQTFVVPPLSVPPDDADIETLSQYDSVKLFIERAQAAQPGFSLSLQNATAISAVCRRLDGISLAIELAAARVRGMTAQQILDRLSQQFQQFGFLSTRSRDVPYRHRTLRATIDWSYQLLDADEQLLFAQLSVFSGGFFLEAAEQVCDVPDALELIFSLQDKSLLTAEEISEKIRYQMSEPLRAYATEKLDDSAKFEKAHAEYYLGIAQSCDQKLTGGEQSAALAEIALELENFRTAMDFTQMSEGKLFGELATALSEFFYIRGFLSEGIQHLRQAEHGLRTLKDNTLLLQVQYKLGRFYRVVGDNETARSLCTKSLQTARELGSKQDIANALNYLGIIARYQGNYEEAKGHFTESLQIARELGDKRSIALSLGNLGLIAQSQNAYDEAKSFHAESLQIARKLGDKRGIAYSLNFLGNITRHQGNYDEAKRLHAESLQIRKELEDKRGIAYSLSNLGNIASHQYDNAEAKRLYAESLEIHRELGDRWGIAISLNNLGKIAWYQRELNEAKERYTESLRIRAEIGNKQDIADSLHELGKLARSEENLEQAALFMLVAAHLYEQIKSASNKSAVNASIRRIQKEIGERRFKQLKEQAQRMPLDRVIDLALV